jgi:hypothetical protein
VTLRGGVSVTRMSERSLCNSERWCECDKDDPSAACVAFGDSERWCECDKDDPSAACMPLVADIPTAIQSSPHAWRWVTLRGGVSVTRKIHQQYAWRCMTL